MKRFIVFAVLFIAGSVLTTACGGGDGGGPSNPGSTLTSIAVTPANASIATGKTQQFTATGTYSDNSTKDITTSVTWNSSDSTRATVDQTTGLATAASNAAGSAVITATSGSVSGTATLKVIINLPQTGQITSYSTGTVSDDGALQRGVPWPTPRFTLSSSGTGTAVVVVTDNLTGLMWTRDGGTPSFTGTTTCNGRTLDWLDALNYVACLNTNGYLGHTDWRLPNMNELRSLVNYEQTDSAVWLNSQGFSNVQASGYWSSTYWPPTYNGGPYTASAWSMNMNNDIVFPSYESNLFYAWPVRDAAITATISLPKTGQTTAYWAGDDGALQKGVAWPNPRFTDNKDGTVTDNLTGLIWFKDANYASTISYDPDHMGDGSMNWQHALDFAAGINAGGHTDWRLPNLNELESLVHAEYAEETTCSVPCASLAAWLNTQGFNNVRESSYWSSTTYAADTASAWVVGMDYGIAGFVFKTSFVWVWPVRGGR